MIKGRHLSEETKKKISNSRIGEKNPNYGKSRSEEIKRKISEALKGKKHPAWKGGKVKIICKICGKEKYYDQCKIKIGQGIFCSNKCSGIWRIKHSKTKDTSIELIIEQELIKRHIPYLKQAPIEGIALVDFLLSDKTIIQCDGNYWHSKKRNKGKDIAQDIVLYFKGYKIFRFTETEIKRSAKKCIDKIIKT